MTQTEITKLWNELTSDVKYICMQYRNSKGELSQYLIDIKANIYECVGKDIESLKSLSFDDPEFEDVKNEMLNKLLYPKKTERNDSSEYENVGKGLKYQYGKYYIKGLLESKEVIDEQPKTTNSNKPENPKKIIGERYLLSDKFRNFILDVERLKNATKEGDILYL